MQESVLEVVQSKLEARLGKLKYGNHLDKCNDYGQMVNSADLETLEKTIKHQVDEFGSIVKQFKSADSTNTVFPPTIIKNVALNSKLNVDEVNGPYLMIIPFRTVKESGFKTLCL